MNTVDLTTIRELLAKGERYMGTADGKIADELVLRNVHALCAELGDARRRLTSDGRLLDSAIRERDEALAVASYAQAEVTKLRSVVAEARRLVEHHRPDGEAGAVLASLRTILLEGVCDMSDDKKPTVRSIEGV